MLKRNRVFFFLSLLFVIGCQQHIKLNLKKTQAENAPLPGYYGQWLYIKTNGTNVLPDMSRYNWAATSNKRSASNALINVYEYGPSNIGGRIKGFIVDKANSNRIIAGGATGGIFISEDNGASWEAINDQALTPSVTGMSQNPFDPEIIYYCSGEAQGNSADILGAGVFKSVDGGRTFNQLPATNNSNFLQNWAIRCSPVDSHTLYVVTQSNGLWRSQDDGATFSKVYVTPAELNDIELLPDGAVMFTMKGGGVYRSPSGDLGTYTKVASINSASSARGEIAFCKNYPNVVYAAISGPDNNYDGVLKAFYKSSDGGKTFVTRKNPTDSVNFGFTWYTMVMSVHDNDSNSIFVGSVSAGYSYDGGQSWKKVKVQHADNHSAFNSGNRMYLGSDGGLCYYDWSNFKSYTSLNNGLNITQFYAGDVSHHDVMVMGGTQDNGTKEGQDMDPVFSSVNGSDGGWAFYHSDSSHVRYYATQNGVVIRNKKNISKNIPTNTDAKWFIQPYHVNEANGEAVFYPSGRTIYHSKNGGKTFDTLGTVIQSRLFSITCSNHKNPSVFAGGSAMFMAVDDAEKANPVVKNLKNSMPKAIMASFLGCIKVIPGYRDKVYLGFTNFSDSGRIYVASKVFSDTPLYKNISGNLPVGLPVNWIECDPMDPERVIFAGTDYGLYVTEDGGQTWVKDTRIPNVVVSSIIVHHNMKDIYLFTHGRGIFKGQINNAGYSSVKNMHNREYAAKVYPNPAGDVMNLRIKSASTGQYNVYDLQGRLVLTGKIEGEISVIPTANLKDGNYILEYKTAEGVGSMKFSVLH